jgi:hypothetical protein
MRGSRVKGSREFNPAQKPMGFGTWTIIFSLDHLCVAMHKGTPFLIKKEGPVIGSSKSNMLLTVGRLMSVTPVSDTPRSREVVGLEVGGR